MSIETTFNEIYAEQYPRLVKWLYWKLPSYLPHVSEDYAQEAFSDLWEMLQKGKTVDYPWALLKRIAQRRMADYFVKYRGEADAVLVAFADEIRPEDVVAEEVAQGRYALGEPELAITCAQLQTAMERMQSASKTWRDLHSKVSRCRARSGTFKDPAVVAKWIAEAEWMAGQRDEALVELQSACTVVGNLRAELERSGGACWQSSCGWPPPLPNSKQPRTGMSDPTVKECHQGHRIDDLENVNFTADGTRNCRTCFTAANQRYKQRQKEVHA